MRPLHRSPILVSVAILVSHGCDLSIGAEDELGDRYAEYVVRHVEIVDDEVAQMRLAALGHRLAAVADTASRDWHFYLVDDSTVNAFAIPGGHVFVNRGLIERAVTMSELAGVMGHEVAHVTLRHGVDQLKARTRSGVLVTLLCTVLGQCGSKVAQIAIGAGEQVFLAGHSREDEREADSVAVEILVEAGIDPRGIPAFFERLSSGTDREAVPLERWFSTHPGDADRTAATTTLVTAYGISALDSLVRNDRGFEVLQERIRSLPRVR